MAYTMYLAGTQMPITPSKVQVKIKNQNKTLNLINEGEINILKAAGLSTVSFEVLLPQSPYPFSNGSTNASPYLSLFERLKTSKEPFQWILNRTRPNGAMLFYTNLTVSMEDYQITDDAGEGFDIKVKINLKQYKPYGTKTVVIQQPDPAPAAQPEPPKAIVQEPARPAQTAPKLSTYTVVKGDCLWNIAKKYLGDGSRYKEIYEANKATIGKHGGGPDMIWAGDVLTIPS